MNPIIIHHSGLPRFQRFGRMVYLATFAAVILTFAAGSSSCRTTQGLGQDIEATGDKIQEAATR